MAALISRFVNVPIALAHPARCPPQPQQGSHPPWLPMWLAQGPRLGGMEGTPPTHTHTHTPPPNNCHPFVGNLTLTTSAPCVPLSYSLPGVHSVTVCFTPDHPLSHSLSPTSIKYLSSIAVSFSLAAFLSVVNSSFSQLSPLSAHSLHLPLLLSLHLDCCSSSLSPLSVPLSSPLILAQSVFIRLCSLSQFGWTRLIASLPLHSTPCLQP